MLRRLRRIFHAWRAERGDTLLTAAVFFLFAAILTLTLTFQGGASVADKLTQTIPFEFRYRNSFLFSPHYQAVPDDDPYLDEKEFSRRDLDGYYESLNWMLDGFDDLGADPRVSSHQYSLCLTCGIQYFSSDDSTPAEEGFTGASDRIFGAESLSFFEDNGLELLSNSNPDAWNADGIFVPDTFQVMDGSGVLRIMQPGDRICCYTTFGQYVQTYTVQGVYHFAERFDYRYGDDIVFNSGKAVVSNRSLRERFLPDAEQAASWQPMINNPVFRLKDSRDFDGFRQRMEDFFYESFQRALKKGVNTPHLRVVEPEYRNVLTSVQNLSGLYQTVLIAVEVMLAILMAGLLWYLVSRKKREMFLYFSLGEKKRKISRHFCLHYALLSGLAALAGCGPGILLSGALSKKVSDDTLELQSVLIRFSNNGQRIVRDLGTVSFFNQKPETLLRGGALAVGATAALAAVIVLLCSTLILRGNLRDFVRSGE